MQILPKIRVKNGEGIGNEIFISPPDIAENERTFISTDAASGVGSFTVENGLKFAVGEYILIGNFGAENAEIIRIHASTAPTATAITFASNTNHAHSRGERIIFIPYNQIAIERSTDAGATYSALATVDLRADTPETYYQHAAGASTDYYRARFSNSATSNTSGYSDGIIATGYAANSAGSVIRQALMQLGMTIDGELITKEFLFSALNEGRDEIDRHEFIERWSFRTVFDYNLGNVVAGQYQVSVPTDLRDPDTNKNILSLRIGRDKRELDYEDKNRLEDHYEGVAHTTLNGAVLATDVAITLTDSGDFDESGSISIAAATGAGTIDAVAYTANNELTGSLTGVTGIATGGHATGKDVWQGASFGNPLSYTVYEDKITFNCPFEDDLAGENIWISYYKQITEVNSEADTLDEPFYKIYIPYIKYRIKARKNPDMKREADDDWKLWKERMEMQVRKEFVGQNLYIIPDTL